MGQHESRLKSLADGELLARLSNIVRQRNLITAEFLAYLAELDERQLFLDLGYASLFEYCVEKLRLCESTAGRHIAAARVCRNHPEAFALVASGALHASALSLLRKHLTADNCAELFALCARKSARKVEELLAARFPRPDVRDRCVVYPRRRRTRSTSGATRGRSQRRPRSRAVSVVPRERCKPRRRTHSTSGATRGSQRRPRSRAVSVVPRKRGKPSRETLSTSVVLRRGRRRRRRQASCMSRRGPRPVSVRRAA